MGKRKHIPEPPMEPLPWADDSWPVVAYCREEVIRQTHDVATVDGIERVGWMLTAWSYALHRIAAKEPALTLADAVRLGQLVEPLRNPGGLRRGNVHVRTSTGIKRFPEWESLPRLLEILFE